MWRSLAFLTPVIEGDYGRRALVSAAGVSGEARLDMGARIDDAVRFLRDGPARAPKRCEICPGVVNSGECDVACSEPKRVESCGRFLLCGECAHCQWRPIEN